MRLSLNFNTAITTGALLSGLAVGAAGPGPTSRAAGQTAGEATTGTVERRVAVMGTALTLRVGAGSRDEALELSERAVRALQAVESRLSTWRDDSELARLNRQPVGAPLALSPALEADLADARACWSDTDGAFDPAVGALVRAWGLREGGRRPDESELDDLTAAGGMATLTLAPGTATRRDPRVELEEGGFGKGIGLDAALAALRAGGALEAMLDLGGQVAILAADLPETIALADPRDRGRTLLAIDLPGGSAATTGNAERGIVVDGTPLGHVLDPRTGRPARDFGSLTVLAPDATRADCLSTGLYVMGPDAALAWARAREGVDLVVVETSPLRVRATPGLAGRLTSTDPTVRIEIDAVTTEMTGGTAQVAPTEPRS